MTLQKTRAEDLEEQALADADQLAHLAYGRDEKAWTGEQQARYLDLIDTAHAEFTPDQALARSLPELIAGLRLRIADLEDAVAAARANVERQQDEFQAHVCKERTR